MGTRSACLGCGTVLRVVGTVVRPVIGCSHIGGFGMWFVVEGARRGIVPSIVALQSDISDTTRHH
ncbi:MAG: hypothetical protein OXF02_01405 [Simkaniaceae bacterium]|nr:hypothetical protein [Simkaniaceae bacterium]